MAGKAQVTVRADAKLVVADVQDELLTVVLPIANLGFVKVGLPVIPEALTVKVVVPRAIVPPLAATVISYKCCSPVPKPEFVVLEAVIVGYAATKSIVVEVAFGDNVNVVPPDTYFTYVNLMSDVMPEGMPFGPTEM